MTQVPFQVRLWGTRGSLPTSGPDYRRFGGNTTCFELRCGPHVLIFDAGSGLAELSADLGRRGAKEAALFFSHFHYDHTIGLPFFARLYESDFRITLAAGHTDGAMPTEKMLGELMRNPFFPIGPDRFRAQIGFADFTPGDVLTPFPGVTLRTCALNHQGGATGYRVDFAGRSAAIITDTEHIPGAPDARILDLISGADLMLYDSTYTDDEMKVYQGFGHSTWQEALRLAATAGVDRVGFVHHSKWRSDAELSEIQRAAKRLNRKAFCARDYQVIDL